MGPLPWAFCTIHSHNVSIKIALDLHISILNVDTIFFIFDAISNMKEDLINWFEKYNYVCTYLYVWHSQKGRNGSNIHLKEHALFACNDCIFILPVFRNLARNYSQVHLFSSVPSVVADFLSSRDWFTSVISSLVYWSSFLYHLEIMQNLVQNEWVSFQWWLAWCVFCLYYVICYESQLISTCESVWWFQP